MDEDIFKDMIDYGDEESNTDTEDIAEEIPEVAQEEETQDEPEFGEYTEDMDEPEYEDEEFETDIDDDDDDRLVAPMIKPILKWLVPLLAVLAVIIFVMTSDIPAIKTYRGNFTTNAMQLLDNMGIDLTKTKESEQSSPQKHGDIEYKEIQKPVQEEITQYRTDVSNDVMITFDGAATSEFARYRDGVICAKTNYLCFIDKKGEKIWEKNISITNPILKTEGDYYVLAQKGGVRFALFSGEEEIYEKSAENNILGANVSAKGDVILITEKTGYKGAIYVYNKRGDNAFAWSSGSSSIMSADISADSRRVAAALLNTDSTVRAGVYLFNIQKPDSYAQQIFDNSIIYNVDFKGDNLSVFADTALIGMNISGKILYNLGFGETELSASMIDDNGDKLMLFTGTSVPMMNVYNKNGKLKNTVSSRKIPDYALVHDGNIMYNVDREIFMSKLGARIPYKYTAAMDVQGLVMVDESTFMVIYSNSISMVKMKGVVW